MDLVERIGWSVGLSGLFLMLAAAVSEMTGTDAFIGGHHVNTHVTATWVLACLGLVLTANGLVLIGYVSDQKSSAGRSIHRSDLLDRTRADGPPPGGPGADA